MGLIVYTTPGPNVTQNEYDANHTTIYNAFNGNIDNANIKAAAGIVDTKLATISTAGKIAATALPSTMTATTFSALVTAQVGIKIDAVGLDIDAGGLTVAGGVTVEDTGLTVDAGGIDIASGNAVDVRGTDGIDYNTGGGDSDVDIFTVQVTGTPKSYWDETEDKFAFTKGLNIDAGGLKVAGGVTVEDTGLTVDAGGITLTAGGLDIASGNAVDVKGINGIDLNAGGADGDIDIFTIQVTGTPKSYWDETEDKFAFTKGLNIDAGGLKVAGGVTVEDTGLTVDAGGITLTAGGLDIASGNAVDIKGTDGIDFNTGAGVDENCWIITVDRSGGQTATLRYITSSTIFRFNTGLNLSSGNLSISSGSIIVSGTVDGVDIAAHASASTTDHGTPIAFSAIMSVDQVITGTEELTFGNESFDVGADFDNIIHTPGEAGKYYYFVRIDAHETGGSDPITLTLELYKNNSTVISITHVINIPANGGTTMSVTAFVQMNGSSDNMRARVIQAGSGTLNIEYENEITMFYGFKQAFST